MPCRYRVEPFDCFSPHSVTFLLSYVENRLRVLRLRSSIWILVLLFVLQIARVLLVLASCTSVPHRCFLDERTAQSFIISSVIQDWRLPMLLFTIAIPTRTKTFPQLQEHIHNHGQAHQEPPCEVNSPHRSSMYAQPPIPHK